jgi:hypothetical protein
VRFACPSEVHERPVEPYRLGSPPLALVLQTGLWGIPGRPSLRRAETPFCPLMDLGSAPEYGPGQTAALRLPSWGLLALRRSRQREATHTGFASPGCAAPSGFLSLLTLSSSRSRPALFHAGGAPGLSPFRGLLLPRGRPDLSAGLPLLVLPGQSLVLGTRMTLTSPPAEAILARAQSSGSPCDPRPSGQQNRASEDASSLTQRGESGLTFRGLSHVGVRASIHRVLP